MAKIAIMGYGTVGSGVYEVIKVNQNIVNTKAKEDIEIQYVLDSRDFPGDPVEEVLTHDFNDILNDDEVSVVVEVMGGVKPAYEFTKALLLKGKSVCTSNKELVAAHGAELIKIAEEKNINYLFEASVGGGIPILRPLISSITADKIQEIKGVLNGTTNYMLTKMSKEGLEYDDVLKDAQNKGYAERNPTADVEGYDACRKISILMSLALEAQVDYNDVMTEGITNITKTDIDYAKAMGKVIKLLGVGKTTKEGSWAFVAPFMIGEDSPLYMVNDVFNGICVTGNMLGQVMFYGRGAGKEATAAAVVSDVVDAIKHKNTHVIINWAEEKQELMPMDSFKTSRFVRVESYDKPKAKKAVSDIFGDVKFTELPELEDEFGFITPKAAEFETDRLLSSLLSCEGIENILGTLITEE
ncbi:MAG: homoserine dehydrogenase [Clostridiales bacterium]|nr:homoserine dehydrogenase [Clostridiales bacterium]